MTAVSVISISRRPGDKVDTFNALTVEDNSFAFCNCTAETFTATRIFPGHVTAVLQASAITHWPTFVIRVVSSIVFMNSFGNRTPRCGCLHRSRASHPTILLVWRLKMG